MVLQNLNKFIHTGIALAYLKLFAIVLMLSLISACATQNISRFHGLGVTQFENEVNTAAIASRLKNHIVVIYNHGSLSEDKSDPCFPNSSFMPGGLPSVIKSLAGKSIQGKQIVVYALCSRVPGRIKLKHTQDNLKIRARVEEIVSEIKRFRAAGVPAENIFLAGHSAGGWASLLIEKTNPELVNAVIAFSPAFAGIKRHRNSNWQRFRNEQQSYLQGPGRIDALVYAFQGDPYNSLADLGFLATIPGVSYKALPKVRNSDVAECYRGHRAVFRRCFFNLQFNEVFQFIKNHNAGYGKLTDSHP